MSTREDGMKDTKQITDACATIIAQQMPKLTDAVHDSDRAGSLTIKIDIKPDKDLVSRVEVSVTPKLSLPGPGGLWSGRLARQGGVVQLTLLSAFDDAA